ncbi:hypothetical protein [Planomicrobium sp. YIM 101495]|uniref:hypothetical protein n=1 Tax=Planomicrobium sp. YIM 101495 TaxID=2665160 RepID=UPI0018A90D9E|nr:hypothetical protein [Planomicrobium sp. YIM 101495]
MPLVVLAALVFVTFLVNGYLSNTYELAFFQNGFESIVALIVAGAFLLILSIINVTVGVLFKNAPTSLHNPKAVWMFTAVFCTSILFFTVWVYPFAEKASYINQLEKALTVAEAQQDDEEITVVFLRSEKNCFRTSTSNCHAVPYKNSFFVKNNLTVPKEVQVRIRAMDAEGSELEEVESVIMTLEPGELRLVETDETSERTSIWSRSSFETERRVSSYESIYQYRDVN